MDGELSNDEAEVLLGKLNRTPEVRQDWLDYHLIGDVLRQPDYLSKDMSSAFFARLQAEPTVLAPQRKRIDKSDFFAMSAVASIMAMAFLAWISTNIDTHPVPQQARHGAMAAAAAAVNSPDNDNINAYLLAHHEFSPGVDVRGAASYIRTVALNSTVAGK